MIKRVLSMSAGVALCMALTAPSAFAIAIVPSNVRPTGEAGVLQPVLDLIYGCAGCVNAATGQNPTGVWSIPGAGPVSAPKLYFENPFAAYKDFNAFGIWSSTNNDSSGIAFFPLFDGIAVAGAKSLLDWTTPGTLNVTGIGAGTFSYGSIPIPQSYFGFYLKGPGTGGGFAGNFWSADVLNPGGAAQMLAYVGGPDRWTFAFEDVGCKFDGCDHGFNDLVVTTESIVPAIPEPSSMLLLGTGLIAVASRLRRRIKGNKQA